ncbi:MAG: class I SAM-dependent methyltransferase [Nitrospirae bacterium]|nr:class I SAM-dependent methyltransferase [Nitrospirota bacterium]
MPYERNNPCLVCSVDQRCCSQLSGLRLTKDEFEKYFKNHAGELAIVEDQKTVVISSHNNGPCPYWENDGCMIYNDRPIDCRLYPYEITRISEKRKAIEVTLRDNPGCPRRERLLMPFEESKALIEVFCHTVYGRSKPIIIKYGQANKGFPRPFGFLNPVTARLFGILRDIDKRERFPSGKSTMRVTRGIKNALLLLWKRDWREFLIRLRIYLGHIDLISDPTETVSERTHYYADSSCLEFDKIISSFTITADDAIVDFGCGKGGILISLSKYPFSKITGVEISRELVEIANKNIRKLKIRNVDIECCDAAEFKQLDEYNYFYFFDPFPCVVMKDVLSNIEKSVIEHPRKVTIIYLNPFCHDLMESSNIFNKTGELANSEHKCFIYSNVVT